MTKKTPPEDMKDAVTAAYGLGVLNERDRLIRMVTLQRVTIKELWEELQRCDEVDPVRGIVIPCDVILDIIRILKQKNLSQHYASRQKFAGRLEKMFQEQGGPAAIKLDAICRVAERAKKQ